MIRTLLTSTALGLALCIAGTLPADANTLRQIAINCGTERSVETGSGETAELVFADGTSVILSPGSSARAQCDKNGNVTITLTKGLIRVSGGFTGASLRINTPNAELNLVAGSAIVEVTDNTTRTYLLNGQGLQVSSGDQDRLIFRPGFQVIASEGTLSSPRRVDAETMIADILALSAGLTSGTPPAVISGGGSVGAGTGAAEEETASLSGSPGKVAVDEDDPKISKDPGPDPGPGPNPDPGPGPGPIDPGPVVTPPIVVSVGNLGSLSGSGGLTPTTGGAAPTQNAENSSSILDSSFVARWQNVAGDSDSESLQLRDAGPRTDRLFDTYGTEFTLDTGDNLSGLIEPQSGLVVFSGDFVGDGPTVFGLAENDGSPIPSVPGYPLGSPEGLLILNSSPLMLTNQDGIDVTTQLKEDDAFFTTSIHYQGVDRAYSSRILIDQTELHEPGTPIEGLGALTTGLNFGGTVCIGDGNGCTTDLDGNYEERSVDNFLILDSKLTLAIEAVCASDSCSQEILELLDPFTQDGVGSYVYVITQDQQSGEYVLAGLIDAPGTSPARHIYAAGDLDGIMDNNDGLPAGVTSPIVDSFHLSTGMEGPVTSGIVDLPDGMYTDDGSRAFLRAESWTDLANGQLDFHLQTSDLTQSAFSIIYPGTPVIGDTEVSPKVFYADFGLEQVGNQQVSTISVTIGEVEFRVSEEPSGEESVDAILHLHTIGSSQGLTATGTTAASVLSYSDLESTAAGGGNTNFDFDTDGVADPGRLGFFVLENAGTVYDDVENREDLEGGVEAPLGAAADQSYALLRLGVGIDSTPVSPTRLGFGAGMTGYAAAIIETEDGIGGVTLSTLGAPDLQNRLTVSDATTANLSFSSVDTVSQSFSATLAGIDLGGAMGESAYIDDKTYAAYSTATELALVSGDAIVAGTTGMAGGSAARELEVTTNDYEFVRWGFFFGDTSGDPKTTDARQHAHLGSYAAVTSLPGDLTNLTTGSVTYSGHAVGNVSNEGQLYSASGTFQDTFDFGSRTGVVTVDFDGNVMTGTSATLGVGQPYTGALPYTGEILGGGVIGELNGEFGGQASLGGDTWAPGAVVGAFTLTGVPGSGPANYTAVGTFAGE